MFPAGKNLFCMHCLVATRVQASFSGCNAFSKPLNFNRLAASLLRFCFFQPENICNLDVGSIGLPFFRFASQSGSQKSCCFGMAGHDSIANRAEGDAAEVPLLRPHAWWCCPRQRQTSKKIAADRLFGSRWLETHGDQFWPSQAASWLSLEPGVTGVRLG